MSRVEKGVLGSLHGQEDLLDIGRSSEVHQAGKGGEKNICVCLIIR